MLTIDTIPLHDAIDCRFDNSSCSVQSAIWQSQSLLGFFVISVLAAAATEFAELKPIRRGLFILGRYVVALLHSVH